MAVEHALAKEARKTTTEEPGITPQILTRWPRERLATQKLIQVDEWINQE